MTVAVVTDSASALPAPLAAAHGVSVVPIWLELDGRAVRDGDVATAEVLAARTVTTSGPSPGEFAIAIDAALQGASTVVVLTVTASLSSTHGAAVVGAAGFGDRVRVVDTGSAAGGQALVVLAAAAVAANGCGLGEVVARAESVADRVGVAGALAGSAHLARSGRVPEMAARAADRLGVRPMFELRAGRVRGLRPARTDGDVGRLTRLCLADRSDPRSWLHAVVMHAGAVDRAATLDHRLRSLASTDPRQPPDPPDPPEPPDVTINPFGPAMVAHTGPGLLGLAWWWEP
jgi:DegV family protein with EDD domain